MRIRIVTSLFTAYILSVSTGCWLGVKMYRPEYDFILSEVKVSEGNGTSASAALIQSQQENLYFEDEWLVWNWSVSSHGRLRVKLKNRTAELITLRWDLASVRLMNEKVSPLVDLNVKYTDRKKPKPLVQLEPESTREESIYPSDFLSSDPFIPQLPGIVTISLKKANEFGLRQLGMSFTIILPVEGFAKTREYAFVMEIKEYHIKESIGH